MLGKALSADLFVLPLDAMVNMGEGFSSLGIAPWWPYRALPVPTWEILGGLGVAWLLPPLFNWA